MKFQMENGEKKIVLEMYGFSPEDVVEVSRTLHKLHDRAFDLSEEQDEVEENRPQKAETLPLHSRTDWEERVPETATGMSALQAAFEAAAPNIAVGIQERKEEKFKSYIPAHPIVDDANLKKEIEALEKKGAVKQNYKISDNRKVLLYQCYYVCTSCKNRGKHYVPKDRESVTCHECNTRMEIKPSEIFGEFPYVDHYGNCFVAGDFHRAGDSY